MGARVQDHDHGYRELVRRVFDAKRHTIEVGILSPKADEPKESRASGGKAGARTLLEVAVWNHFGTSRIPARPFITGWFDQHEREIHDKLVGLMRSSLRGQRTPEQVLDLMGLWCVGEIQRWMAEGVPPPLAASTVARKGSSQPLIDTGQLRSSVTFRVDGGKSR